MGTRLPILIEIVDHAPPFLLMPNVVYLDRNKIHNSYRGGLSHTGWCGGWGIPPATRLALSSCRMSCDGLLQIQVLLEAHEYLSNLLRSSQINHGIGNRIVIFQMQQRVKFALVEFFHADADIVG